MGGRVIVPFRQKRLCGIVTELHDREPNFTAKPILQVLDTAPALTPDLLQLGRWIAQYYIAPIGEVFRTMLPLSAEFRRVVGYRITTKGFEALHAASTVDRRYARVKIPTIRCGNMPLSIVWPTEKSCAKRVCDRPQAHRVRCYRHSCRRSGLRAKTSAMFATPRERSRRDLKAVDGKLNANQQAIVDYLQGQPGQRAQLDELRELRCRELPFRPWYGEALSS